MSPEVLGDRYELGELLGAGGMARVYRATDGVLGRTVAVKVLDPRFSSDREFVERFRREARGAAGLSHPNLVAVFDTGEDAGRYFIVMELVEGRTLSDVIAAEAPIPPERAAAIAADVCDGLAAAHEAGLVHRDVKPGNVLLTEADGVKVADFGIARAVTADTLTQGDMVLGTAAYLSPEQAAGKAVDARADLYALGCVLHQMLSGSPPFTGDTPVAVAGQHINKEPPPLPDSVPPSLAAVVDRALSKDPGDRFPDASSMGAALRGAARGGDTRVLTEPLGVAPGPRISPRMLGVAAAALIVLGVALGLALMGSGDDTRPAGSAEEPPAATTASPSPSPPEERPTTIDGAFGELTTTVGDAVASGGLEEKLGEEVLKKAGEALEKFQEGKAEEALGKLAEAREKLAQGVEKDEASPAAALEVDTALQALAEAIQSASPPAGEEDDDGGGNGRGNGRGRGRGNSDHGGEDDD